ncbi:hypothetical protein DY000_02032762 [Brassica cretica]|uniref:F-box associated beta-propeller type 3 domain-containing protein n=1 Tax=Brassica cretica TaxID=69181 RepID=A0ABQ7DGJ2_BRACR|nr:hypothetical protein DY000_02032762 [Brassica cretica]
MPSISYTMRGLTWLGGMCLPLMRSNITVPKMKGALSGVTLPDARQSNTHRFMCLAKDIRTSGGSPMAPEGISSIRRTLVRIPLTTRIWAIAFGSFECPEEGPSVGCNSTRRLDDGKLYFFSAPQIQNTVAYSSLVATRYHTLTLKGFSETRYLLQGLVCFQYWRRDYTMTPMVCNPVTGEFITLPEMKATLQGQTTYFGSEKFSYIKIDDESTTGGACTLINYEGKLGGVEFTDIDRRNLRLWLVEQDHAGKYKWSSNIYELTLSLANFYIVGMTGASDIVLSPYHLLDPFYVFYYNVERKALTRVEIQGFQKFKRLRPRVYTFQDYLEDVKLMECL